MCLAIPGKIVELSADRYDSALVEVLGVRRRVDLGLLEDNRPVVGDWVLIHVGFAMSKISASQAHEQLEMLASLGEAIAAQDEAAGYQFGVDT